MPALLFGVAGICQKLSNQHGISTGAYVLSVGLGVVMVGVVHSSSGEDFCYPIELCFPR